MHVIRATTALDRAAIATLLDRSFGPERHTRAAYRLRANASPCAALSHVVVDQAGTLLASIEFWHVRLLAEHATLDALLLGPIAVEPARRGEGIGVALIEDGIARARMLGNRLIMLVGDLDYYDRFGFSNALTGNWHLPGPVEQHRVLALPLTPGLELPDVADVVGHRRADEQAA